MATYLLGMLAIALPSALEPVPMDKLELFVLLIFILTFVLPAANIGIFRVLGTIQTLEMRERRERVTPFIFTLLIYVAVTYLFRMKYGFSWNDNLMKLMLIVDALVFVSTVTTFFFKVSVHSIAIWGLVGMTLLLTKISEVNTLFYFTIVLIGMAGVVMSSRLQLTAHTYREVMWGSVLGLATSVLGMTILF